MKEKKLSGNLSGLRSELERRLIVMRYSKVTTQKYLMIFGWVKDYLAGYGETAYTKESGRRFLTEYTLQSVHSPIQFKSARVTIRRLDEILENKPFTPCFRETKHECPPRFTASCDTYL